MKIIIRSVEIRTIINERLLELSVYCKVLKNCLDTVGNRDI